ncbi:MAG: hypothetical protein ACYDEP_11115 [Acidimicrobiales bacterium]
MKVDKLGVSFDPDLGDAVHSAAKESGYGLSGSPAEAAWKLRNEVLAAYLTDWEAEYGPLSDEEVTQACGELRVPSPQADQSTA